MLLGTSEGSRAARFPGKMETGVGETCPLLSCCGGECADVALTSAEQAVGGLKLGGAEHTVLNAVFSKE